MRKSLALSGFIAFTPVIAHAVPSMIGQWSCENYSETNQVLGTVAYYDNGRSEGSFDASVINGDVTVEMIGAYRADWLQENTLLVETITWVDIQDLLINGQSFLNTPTEKEFEGAILAEGKTFSQIIDSSEVSVVLEDSEGNISSCALF